MYCLESLNSTHQETPGVAWETGKGSTVKLLDEVMTYSTELELEPIANKDLGYSRKEEQE